MSAPLPGQDLRDRLADDAVLVDLERNAGSSPILLATSIDHGGTGEVLDRPLIQTLARVVVVSLIAAGLQLGQLTLSLPTRSNSNAVPRSFSQY